MVLCFTKPTYSVERSAGTSLAQGDEATPFFTPALMAKMRIEPAERPRVKAECLRLLATLRLDPTRTRLISGFVDTYLMLNAAEVQVFKAEVGRLEESEQKGVMEIVTSWMQQGIEQGAQQEARSLVLRQLSRKVGVVPESVQAQINALSLEQVEALAEALLDFGSLAELQAWLAQLLS